MVIYNQLVTQQTKGTLFIEVKKRYSTPHFNDQIENGNGECVKKTTTRP